jgi:hypothetical protein
VNISSSAAGGDELDREAVDAGHAARPLGQWQSSPYSRRPIGKGEDATADRDPFRIPGLDHVLGQPLLVARFGSVVRSPPVVTFRADRTAS